MIRLESVTRIFASRDGDDIVALEDVSLDIAQNAFVCVVGPSGCGKSTLLRLVAGLVPPSSGTITIGGVAVTEPRADIGIVFQAPTLLPWATVLDNVLFPLRMMNRLAPDSRDRAMDLIRLVGLGGFEHRYPRELSGGMQQRAGICRALVHDPAILLMDEPFGALDALTREELTLELQRIWSDKPKTIIFVTHSISEATLLADRVAVMSPRPGRIVELIDVGLPRPRDFDMEGHPAFQSCAHRVRERIFGGQSRRAA